MPKPTAKKNEDLIPLVTCIREAKGNLTSAFWGEQEAENTNFRGTQIPSNMVTSNYCDHTWPVNSCNETHVRNCFWKAKSEMIYNEEGEELVHRCMELQLLRSLNVSRAGLLRRRHPNGSYAVPASGRPQAASQRQTCLPDEFWQKGSYLNLGTMLYWHLS